MSQHCDVLVVGGGPSGMAAALSAAAHGAEVVLLEAQERLGGVLRDGLFFPICGLFRGGDQAPAAAVNSGSCAALVEAMCARHPDAIRRMGRTYVLAVPPAEVVDWFSERLAERATVRVLTQTRLQDAIAREGRISAVVTDCGRIELGAAIDTSGGGALLRAAAVELIAPESGAPNMAGYALRLDGVLADDTLPVRVPYCLSKAVASGRLPQHLKYTSYGAGHVAGEGFLKLNLPADGDARADADAAQVVAVLVESEAAFASARIVETSPGSMEREGPRMRGRYALTREDVLAGRAQDDAVAVGTWPIEFWSETDGPRYDYVGGDGGYDIPARALQAAEVSNLFAGGRCVSADRDALASLRVMGTCMAVGQAAGRLAAEVA